MIDPIELEFDAPATTYRPRVIYGVVVGLDVERFAQTMALLETYVDSLLAADGPPTMDPWIDDEDLETRISCL
jgi:hypothetical protein